MTTGATGNSAEVRFVFAIGVLVSANLLLTPFLWDWCYAVGSSVVSDETWFALRGAHGNWAIAGAVLSAVAVAWSRSDRPLLCSCVAVAAAFTSALLAMTWFRWRVVMAVFWFSPAVLVPAATWLHSRMRFFQKVANPRQNLIDRV